MPKMMCRYWPIKLGTNEMMTFAISVSIPVPSKTPTIAPALNRVAEIMRAAGACFLISLSCSFRSG